MATRCMYESSNEIGVFSALTNAYALVAIGGSENFYSVFEQEVGDHIPVVHTSIAGEARLIVEGGPYLCGERFSRTTVEAKRCCCRLDIVCARVAGDY